MAKTSISFETDFSLHKKALACIGQGYLTNSKRPECFIKGIYPTHFKKGFGCYLFDHKNVPYIDFITGLGTNLLGYANPLITQAAISAINDGNLFSLGSDQEIKTAEKLKEVFPFVDSWKFLKTGNEACLASLRIARASSKKSSHLILCEGFHGHGDEFSCLEDATNLGVPFKDSIRKLTKDFTDKDIEEASAVIIEPVITDFSDERRNWLISLREKCTRYQTCLIFDEIVTGFRFPKFSLASYWGIEPDLIVVGKAMANGFSLAAVGGKYERMNSSYFVSSTYASSNEALAACEKVIETLQKSDSYKLDDLWQEGLGFISDFNKLWPQKIWIEGYPTRGVFKGDDKIKALFFQEACRARILLGPTFFFNFPLKEMSFAVMSTFKDIIYRIKSGNVSLLGEMPKAALAQRIRK